MRLHLAVSLGFLPFLTTLSALSVPTSRADEQVASLGDQTITIDEWDKNDGTMGLTLNAKIFKTGPVTFSVTNKSIGSMAHEVLVIPAPADLSALPLEASGAKVDEDKLEGLEEGVELEPGKSGTKTINLAPGTYMVFCNEPGHFAAGMHELITVTK